MAMNGSTLALQLAQQFLDVPSISRVCMASSDLTTMETWRNMARQLWRAQGVEEPWDEQSVPQRPLPVAFAECAKSLWLHTHQCLLQVINRDLACPGMLERATIEVFALGLHGCNDLSDRSMFELAELEPEQEAEADYVARWMEHRELGPELMDAFKQMNEHDAVASAFLNEIADGFRSFKLFPAHWNEDNDAAIAVLHFELHGFSIAIIATENFVDPYGFNL